MKRLNIEKKNLGKRLHHLEKIISYRMKLKGMINLKYINFTHGYEKH